MDSKWAGLVGVPFVNGGRNAITGLDCWGLVLEVFERYGAPVPDFAVDSFAYHIIDALAGEAVESRKWEEVYRPLDEDAPLVVLMRMHPKFVTHAGVFIGHGKIIHAMAMTGVTISRVASMKGRITGYYRHIHKVTEPCSK